MIALISDVHGNLPALEAVLADVERAGITRVWCLGDTLGYGPYPNECMRLVAESCELLLAGNHDLAVRGDIPAALFGGTAGAGVRFAREHADEHTLSLLAQLSPQRILEDVELYHASAADPVWEYVTDEVTAARHLGLQRLPLSFVGHSHMQLAFELREGESRPVGGLLRGGATLPELEPNARRVVNPGSVGQPRDHDWRAGWAQVSGTSVTFHRVEYDVQRMAAAVAEAGLPTQVAERLEVGW